MRRKVESLARPVSREMEFRADHCSADACGSDALASALEKLAVVQPIFQEILSQADPAPQTNVYRTFSRIWKLLKGPTYDALKQKLVDDVQADEDDLHPPVVQRIDRLRAAGRPRRRPKHPSLHLLDNPARLEQMLHNHLFSASDQRPTTFRPTNIRED
jgi:hypothetical protein